jgi:hypothetical protein
VQLCMRCCRQPRLLWPLDLQALTRQLADTEALAEKRLQRVHMLEAQARIVFL